MVGEGGRGVTRARNGAVVRDLRTTAPARAPAWHVIPDDDDRGPSKTFPPCADGDELLARLPDGEVVPVTVDRRGGCWFVGPDGDRVDPDAIATRPTLAYRPGARVTEAQHRAAGLHALKVRLPAAYVAKLDALCEDSGYSRAEQIMGMIDGEAAELARLRR